MSITNSDHTSTCDLTQLANSKAWPVVEANKVIERVKALKKQIATFETGYGPSGLPHLGTICEVIRTSMVKKAYDILHPVIPSRLLAFVDDMDGLRKVPGNVPQADMLAGYLNYPLTQVPDPFGQEKSFADYNAKRFEHLLDQYGYLSGIEVKRAHQEYKSGRFNFALLDILKHHIPILEIMKEHLREERFSTYSPFLPISPVTGKILQVAMTKYTPSTITFQAEDKQEYTTPVVDGYCKLQWKPDLGMRWYALGVDYEIYGKDLESSVEIASKICQLLGNPAPLGFQYEHFLAPDGSRVSKSKGNESVTVQAWLNYTPKGTLEHFIFQNPRRAKRLRIHDIPNYVEAFLEELSQFDSMSTQEQYESAIFYINHKPNPTNISFKLALSIACATHIQSEQELIQRLNISTDDALGLSVARCAFAFFQDCIKANLKIEPMPTTMHVAVNDLIAKLKTVSIDADNIQNAFFTTAKEHNIPFKDWFTALYKALLGAEQGPKLGSFCVNYGVEKVINLLSNQIS